MWRGGRREEESLLPQIKAVARLGLVSEQSIYNLIERTVELEVLPACQDFGVGVTPWSPLHGELHGGVICKGSWL